jgi:hypothetical protein
MNVTWLIHDRRARPPKHRLEQLAATWKYGQFGGEVEAESPGERPQMEEERGGWAYKKQKQYYFTLVVQLTCLTMRALILCLATGMSQGPYLAPFFGKNFGICTSLVIIAPRNHMID